MMMQMLAAGGIKPFSDSQRAPDDSNPRGYYETTFSKGLANYNSWIRKCPGKAVKVVAPLIPYLPQGISYKIVMMIRGLDEILESQGKMLERLDRPGGNLTPERFRAVFDQQLQNCRSLFRIHGIQYLEVRYSQVVSDPISSASLINSFLDSNLNIEKMAAAVAPELYRQKKPQSGV